MSRYEQRLLKRRKLETTSTTSRLETNGRSTGILSDGTRVNVYRYQGAGNEWTAALHYPDGGYSALTMGGDSPEFNDHDLEGPHMGTFIPWDAVPGNIKRDIEQRAVESSMVANGRGAYHKMGLSKNDMIVYEDHRGRWRVDLITSSSGNHVTIGPTAGYAHAYDAGAAARAEHHKRGLRTGLLYRQQSNGEYGLFYWRGPEGTTARLRDQEVDEGHEPNGRKKKITVADLPSKNRVLKPGERSKVLACPGCGEEYSADPSDYFMMRPGEPFRCQACGEYLQLADRKPQARSASQVVVTRGNDDAWDDAENAGLVQIITNPDEDPDVSWADEDDLRIINQDGMWCYASQFRRSENDAWQTADSICGVVGAMDDDLEKELRRAALDALGGHVRNGRATTVDPVAARELDLYIANTYELVGAPNSIGKSIDTNLRRKLASGKYDPALAPKAWQYLVDEGARRYQKEFGSDSPIFNAATRRQVAADFARAWEDESQLTRNASKKTIRFVRAGQVERWQPSRKGYVWHEGYSEDGNTQPWLTRREAQESARSRGARAVFEG